MDFKIMNCNLTSYNSVIGKEDYSIVSIVVFTGFFYFQQSCQAEEMTRGWFDLFRDNGGPALYPESNRTSVVGDVQAITVYIVFATLLVAFLVVMPGMRREVVTCFVLRILTFKGSN